MIQIKPVEDKATLQALCQESKITYSDSIRCAVMQDGDARLGYALFTCLDGYAIIHALEPINDLSLADGMLRSVIHIALRSDCLSVYYDDTAPEAVFKKLGFVMNSQNKQLNTYKLFETCEGCK